MKKVTETPERILIHVDNSLAKFNKQTLDAIFAEVEKMKTLFLEIEITFNQANFIKTMQEGCQWIKDLLYNTFVDNNYKGLSQKIIDAKVPRDQFNEFVAPIETLISKIDGLLKKIELTADQIPFNAMDEPIINNELKEILSEASKRYVVGSGEIELYHAILTFIESINALEASLTKTGFPLLFTKYLDFNFPMPNCESDHFAYPICLANYDNLLEDSHATLIMNPDYFENIRAEMKALSDRQEFEQEMRSLPTEVRFNNNRTVDIPAGQFKTRLPKEVGKMIEDFASNPDPTKTIPSKGRWKGLPGV